MQHCRRLSPGLAGKGGLFSFRRLLARVCQRGRFSFPSCQTRDCSGITQSMLDDLDVFAERFHTVRSQYGEMDE